MNKVYLVGAGPGDPGLLTVKAFELIKRADCIVYDALVSPEIMLYAPSGAEKVDVGKRAGHHKLAQDEINELLVKCGRKYALTVRLKGGDPYVFGRGGEEALYLKAAKVAFEVVPGISSALAGPAYAGIPVSQRGMNTQFTIFTGHEMPGKEDSQLDIEGIAAAQGTKIMLMGMSKLQQTMQALIAAGQSASTPAAAIQWAATPRQRKVCSTVGQLAADVAQAGLGAPAVVVIGEVVALSDKLDITSRLPLFGKRVGVTRTRAQASSLSAGLRELGADVLEMPTIRITDPTDRHGFAEAVVDCPQYDWLVFSSPNGVKRFMRAFFAVYEDIREIGGARIAAVGPATAAELKKHGLMVDVVPQKAVAEELIAEFDRKASEFGGVEHCSMLWVHSEKGRDVIYKELMKRKAIVDECVAYNTVIETEDPTGARKRLLEEGAQLITFTSSSTVENFLAMGLQIPPNCLIASIGPVTTATLKQHGLRPHIESSKHTVPSLLKSIQTYFS